MDSFKIGMTIVIVSISLASIGLQPIFGHGLTSEILPPEKLGDKQVTLQAAAIPLQEPKINGKQVEITLTDSNTGAPIREVTYSMKVLKNDKFLFKHDFQKHDGVLIFDLVPSESKEITVEEQSDPSTFETVIGVQGKSIVKGPVFNEDGLYNFEIDILTADSYSNQLERPIRYNFGLSFPQITQYKFTDSNFGEQQLDFIAYYDEINSFDYNSKTNIVRFELPFEWSESNIAQSPVVHHEIIVPKEYTELMVSDFSVL